MPRLGGYATIADPDRPLFERDTVACGHCQKVVFVKPGTGATVYLILHVDDAQGAHRWVEEAGAFCRICMRPVCLRCHGEGGCRPFERLLEQMERPHVSV